MVRAMEQGISTARQSKEMEHPAGFAAPILTLRAVL
jgi:hypothetical protein